MRDCFILNSSDLVRMGYAHIFGIFTALILYKPTYFGTKFTQFVKVANIFVYQLAILSVQLNFYMDVNQSKDLSNCFFKAPDYQD
jgi:hypothetical protein